MSCAVAANAIGVVATRDDVHAGRRADSDPAFAGRLIQDGSHIADALPARTTGVDQREQRCHQRRRCARSAVRLRAPVDDQKIWRCVPIGVGAQVRYAAANDRAGIDRVDLDVLLPGRPRKYGADAAAGAAAVARPETGSFEPDNIGLISADIFYGRATNRESIGT